MGGGGAAAGWGEGGDLGGGFAGSVAFAGIRMNKVFDKSPSECSGEETPRPSMTGAPDTIIATPHEIIQAVHQVLMDYFEFVLIGDLGVAFEPDEADSVGWSVVHLLEQQKRSSNQPDSETLQSNC